MTAPEMCCRGRTCDKCRNATRFAAEFRKWIDGGYRKPKK